MMVCTHPGDRGHFLDLVLSGLPWDGVLPVLSWDDVLLGLSDPWVASAAWGVDMAWAWD